MIQRRIQRFEVVDQLGAGGMGQVFRARDPELERDVAIKMLAVARPPSELSARDTLDLRSDRAAPHDELLREARIMARLSHPNVLPVYEVGLADGSMFLVMEHIEGTDLAAWLAVPRSTEAILGVFLQVARGLEAAHACGIVHRDIKPGNILIGRDGRVRVADFGLSRLSARPATAMVYVDDGRGTPRYMAPELWRGSAATVASDVYALCVTLGEALRERAVSPRLRALLARGRAEDPAMRPELGELIAALEGQRSRRRAWLVAAISAAAVAAVIAGGVLTKRSAESRLAAAVIACDPDPKTLVGRWDDNRQGELARVLALRAQPEPRSVADRLLSDIAGHKQSIDRAYTAACEALRAGDLTVDQYRTRASCLQRRGFEIAETVNLLIDMKPTLLDARDRFRAAADPRDCVETIAPPIANDPIAVESLWRRYIRAGVHLANNLDELTAIAEAAAEIGESELVARANRWRANAYRNKGDLSRSELELQNVYRQAQELRVSSLVIATLLDRSFNANERDDDTATLNFAELATQMADRGTTTPTLRARAYRSLGDAYEGRGDEETAIMHFRTALDILGEGGGAVGTLEMGTRAALVWALSRQAVQEPGTVALGNQNVELARTYAGTTSGTLGHALVALGQAYSAMGDYARAIPYRREGVEILIPRLSTVWQSNLVQYKTYLAWDLRGAGRLEEAQREIDVLQKVFVAQPRHKWVSEGVFALVAFELGKHDDGLARARRALDEAISDYSKQSNRTSELRSWVIEMLLERGKLDDAAYHFAALEAVYAEHPARDRLRLHRLRATLGAELAIARGKPGVAIAMARAALEAAGKLRATDRDRADFLASLGSAFAAERAWSQAQEPLTEALALLNTVPVRPDDVAAVEVELASVEQGLGDRASALARAKRARAVLADYPGKLRARAKADRLLRGEL